MSIIQSYWKFIVLALVVGVVVVGVLTFASPSPPAALTGDPDSSGTSLSMAFSNIADEAAERLDSSPLQIIGTIADTMNKGSLTLAFDFRDNEMLFGGNMGGSFVIFSDMENSEFATEIEINLLGGFMSIDFDIYFNSERIAFRSGIMGNDFYGITFSTFREDIAYFGPLIGLDDDTIEQIADSVEAFGAAIISGPDEGFYSPAEYLEPYIDLFAEFISSLEYSTETVAGATRIQFIVTEEHVLSLLNNLHTMLEEDENLRSSFEMFDDPLMQDMDMPTYNEILRGIRDAIRTLEDDVTIEFILEFYIDSQNRLSQMNIRASATVDNMPVGIVSITADFGRSLYDPWVVDLTYYADEDALDSSDGIPLFNFTWNFSDESQVFENTFDMSFDDESLTLASSWAPESGEFTLSFEGGGESGSLGGIFTVDEYGGSFLQFDDFNPSPTQTLSISIAALPGAEILPIEFINLDEWGQGFIDAIGMLTAFLP